MKHTGILFLISLILYSIYHFILYQIQVQEESEFQDEEDNHDIGLEKNTNFSSIQQAEKERREQARLESHNKKEKDKADRYELPEVKFKLVLNHLFFEFSQNSERNTTPYMYPFCFL